MGFILNNLDHSQGCIYILVLMFCYRPMTLPLFSLRIELLDKLCRDLKILYLQSNLIPKIGKLCWEKSIHQEEWRFYQELKEKQPLGVFFFQEFVFRDMKHFLSYCLPFFRSGWMGNEAFLRGGLWPEGWFYVGDFSLVHYLKSLTL